MTSRLVVGTVGSERAKLPPGPGGSTRRLWYRREPTVQAQAVAVIGVANTSVVAF